MKAKEVAKILENFAPLSLQESWDNSGFCVGNPDQEINSVMLGLDPTPNLIEEAVEKKCNMVITHHPLIFGGIKNVLQNNIVGKTIISAIKHDVIIYSIHTNIDKVIDGVSGQMAKKLNLKEVEILAPGVDGNGLGIVGDLEEALDEERFFTLLKKEFALDRIRTTQRMGRKIGRVAMCGGSGKSLIQDAISSKADVYVTGDLSYHDFLSYPDILLADIGHFESEIDIVQTIYSILEKIPNFAVQISRNNNPVYYY